MSEAARAFDATYLDGGSSRPHAVRVEVHGATACIRGDGVAIDLAVAQLRMQPRLARLPLRIELPGGGVLVADAQAVAQALPLPAARGVAHRLESHLGVVLASLAGVAVAAWLAYDQGIPWLARHAAEHLPPELEAQLAREGLEALDKYFVKPTQLDAGRREALHGMFRQVAAAAEGPARSARLEFRDGQVLGANALALPGGVVMVTDQLVALLDDERVVAVLAHELGHLQHRHGARHILQDTIAGLVVLAVFGDASNVAAVAATAPTILINNGFSRDFEREADARAHELLRRVGRSPALLGDALEALEKHQESRGAQCRPERETRGRWEVDEPADDEQAPEQRPDRSYLGYVSTHPATAERIREARRAALSAP